MGFKPRKTPPDDQSQPDCQTCGLCCIPVWGKQDVFCDLTEDDVRRLPTKQHVVYPSPMEALAAAMTFDDTLPFALLKTKRLGNTTPCVYLQGRPGEKVSCQIYEQRPQTCRESMTPGEPACLKLRTLLDHK